MGLDQREVEAAFVSALKVWTEVADITFAETSLPNQRDSIDFKFETVYGFGQNRASARGFKDPIGLSDLSLQEWAMARLAASPEMPKGMSMP